MKKFKTLAIVLGLSMMICACGNKNAGPAAELKAENTATAEIDESTTVSEDLPETEDIKSEAIADEQAIEAIRNYCCTINPDLESIAAEEYPVYWEIASSDDGEIVVLFRSYTGAQVRYYIDRTTGITNSTEFVPGITDEEEPVGESFNVRDYIN